MFIRDYNNQVIQAHQNNPKNLFFFGSVSSSNYSIVFFSFRQISFPLTLQAVLQLSNANWYCFKVLQQSPFHEWVSANLSSSSSAFQKHPRASSGRLDLRQAAPLLWQLMAFLGSSSIALLWELIAWSQSFREQQAAPKFRQQVAILGLISIAFLMNSTFWAWFPIFPVAFPFRCQNSLCSPRSRPISQHLITSSQRCIPMQALALIRQVYWLFWRGFANYSIPLQSFFSFSALILSNTSLEVVL